MEENEINIDVKEQLLRYFSFWPWFLASTLIFMTATFFYLRYVDYFYESKATIEIIDKAQDTEMALPTAMTIFNRSMINLENEIGVLSSYKLHERVVETNNYNILYFTVGSIKSIQKHPSDWYESYELEFLIDTDSVSKNLNFDLYVKENSLHIDKFGSSNEFIKTYKFNGLSTTENNHDLPFELTLPVKNLSEYVNKRSLQIRSKAKMVEFFRSNVEIEKNGELSDQLILKILHPNANVANDYLNDLIDEFNDDGIKDRQLVFKRTIDFVDSRFDLISGELEAIENARKEFKQTNELTDLESNSSFNITQQLKYDSELFDAKSQLDLCVFIEETIRKDNFKLIPLNIGINNDAINMQINSINLLVLEREKLLISAGEKNSLVKNNEKQIANLSKSLKESLKNYKEVLEINIDNIESKEDEFLSIYKNLPNNEKILRSIERELNVKEALFILLMQKREEASINYAVVKPSIKVVDYSRNSNYPVSPIPVYYYFGAFSISLFIPFLILFTRFSFDTKIHTRDMLSNLFPEIPILGEVPYIPNPDKFDFSNMRNPIMESFRMIASNLEFTFNDKNGKKSIVTLVTSSIKGEGKTIISYNLANILASKTKKVLLIGADLRNPQIHKFLNSSKEVNGLSDFIYRDDLKIEDLIIQSSQNPNLSILLSGTIPPNPTELLSSNKFTDLIDNLRDKFDDIIIDSAPCLIVSDTFEISRISDRTVYVARANFTDKNLESFINDTNKKLHSLNFVLNSVGISSSYGYKYGYQYGYKYGYNYGYGYNYEIDN